MKLSPIARVNLHWLTHHLGQRPWVVIERGTRTPVRRFYRASKAVDLAGANYTICHFRFHRSPRPCWGWQS